MTTKDYQEATQKLEDFTNWSYKERRSRKWHKYYGMTNQEIMSSIAAKAIVQSINAMKKMFGAFHGVGRAAIDARINAERMAEIFIQLQKRPMYLSQFERMHIHLDTTRGRFIMLRFRWMRLVNRIKQEKWKIWKW